MFFAQFEWRQFKIDLPSLYKFAEANIDQFDGIIAQYDFFEIVKKEEILESEIEIINGYMADLEESAELEKINRPKLILESFERCKLAMVEKTYDQMSVLERKILLNVELSEEDIQSLIESYP